MQSLLFDQKSRFAPYIFIVIGVVAAFITLGSIAPVRVGDGSEYYALFYAFDISLKPWMTSPAYMEYEKLFYSGDIIGLVQRETLEGMFKALQLENNSDFNHFWVYSFLAFVCAKVFLLVGVDLHVHQSFLVLHAVLLILTLSVSYKLFQVRGVFVVILMTFISPMFWFLDKVHTEFFTYSLVLIAVMLVYAKYYMYAALFLAVASTQNPSFALIACIPLVYRFFFQREKAYSFFELVVFASAAVAVLLHPAYYFFRHDVITPQLLAGGVSLGGNLTTFYIWIVDPDLGLLPNWPLGLVGLLLLLSYILFSRTDKKFFSDKKFWVFVALYLMINFYAHSSTTNLNSGATPGLARYALWYLPLAFPVLYSLSELIKYKSPAFYFSLIMIMYFSVTSMRNYDPRLPERYQQPSDISLFIQTKIPWLYNPPQEVFLERYSGLGDLPDARLIRGVIGPDCKKLMLMSGEGKKGASSVDCLLDPVKLDSYINSLPLDFTGYRYLNLSESDLADLYIEMQAGNYKVGSGESGNYILGRGWSKPEPWGVWSNDDIAILKVPCNGTGLSSSNGSIPVTLTIQPFLKQNLTVMHKGERLWEGTVAMAKDTIHFSIPSVNCKSGFIEVSLNISDAESPAEIGLSADGRRLGIGLMEFHIGNLNNDL